MRVGVVGYSGQKFDTEEANSLLIEAFEELGHFSFAGIRDKSLQHFSDACIVSGLTNLGIPALAYKIASDHFLKTMGIACSKAKDYDCYPCDRVHIIGNNWGDESEAFLASIDYLIRIGGGKQSHAECQRAKELGIIVIEKELEALP